MSIADYKGHLIARRLELEQQQQEVALRVLQLKHDLAAMEMRAAQLNGSSLELRTLLCMLDNEDKPAAKDRADLKVQPQSAPK